MQDKDRRLGYRDAGRSAIVAALTAWSSASVPRSKTRRTHPAQRRDGELRVLIVVGRFPTTSETFIVDQIAGLIERGVAVDVYAEWPGTPGPQHEAIARLGLIGRTHYRPWSVGTRVSRLRRVLPRLVRAIISEPRTARVLDPRLRRGRQDRLRAIDASIAIAERGPYDVVHCHFGDRGIPFALLKAAGVLASPLLVTFHGKDVTVYPRALGPDCYRELFREMDLATVGTRFIRGRLTALGAPESKLELLPMGVGDEAFQVSEPDGTIVLSVGRLIEVKGFELGVRAMAPILRNVPRLRYRIVGEGPLREPLLRLALRPRASWTPRGRAARAGRQRSSSPSRSKQIASGA